jgi:hypothetical protein
MSCGSATLRKERENEAENVLGKVVKDFVSNWNLTIQMHLLNIGTCECNNKQLRRCKKENVTFFAQSQAFFNSLIGDTRGPGGGRPKFIAEPFLAYSFSLSYLSLRLLWGLRWCLDSGLTDISTVTFSSNFFLSQNAIL